jgi:hypothetical protein
MSLQIRRGTDAQRQQVVFDLGEIVYTTDTKKLYIGDGVGGVGTAGGVNVLASSAGTGLSWNSTTQTLNFSGTLSGYTTDNLAQGTVNLYYLPSRAKADIATMFTATGSSTVTGTVTATTATTISFVGAVSTVNGTGVLTYTSGTVPQVGMIITGTGINASPATYIVSGTSPTFILNQVPTAAGTGVAIQGAISLVSVGSASGLVALEPFTVTGTGGGGLSAATYYIINPTAGSNQISLATSLANAQTGVAITNLTTATLVATTFTAGGPDANITFSYNPVTGTMSVNSAASGITSVVQDTAPRLGGDLVLNSKNITGTGSINITGGITASGALGITGTTTLGTANITTGNITNVNTSFINAPDAGQGLQISAKVGNSFALGYYNGTAASPTNIVAGAGGMVLSIKGYIGSNNYAFAGGAGAQFDVGATLTDAYPKSSIGLFAGAGGSTINQATLTSAGVWNAPALQTTVYSVAGTALPSASTVGVGARAFVSDATATTYASAYTGSGSNKVPVYSDGTVWRIG